MKDFMQGERCISFDPIVCEDSEILILGTYPSLKSFETGFYYAHPQNQFWKILGDLFDEETGSIASKKALLKAHKIALWDTCHSCIRKEGNSSDTNLSAIEPNDIASLLKKYSAIRLVCFTGKKAESIYRKHFADLPIATASLPSPSPAYRAMDYETKKTLYKVVLLG